MNMDKKQFIHGISLRNRIICILLSILMLASMLPFGAIMSVSAANNNPSFIFTDKNGTGISGVTITLVGADGKKISSEPSDNNGTANFIKDIPVIGSSYDYTVNNTGTYIAEPGNITINDNSPIKITLYAPAPTGRIKPVDQTPDINGKVSFSVDIDNAENSDDLNYQWYEGDNAITGETNAQLSTPILPSEAKDYYCEVTSALSQDGVKAVFKASDAVPHVSLRIDPISETVLFSTISITVTVTPNVADGSSPSPKGQIEFYVDDEIRASSELDENGTAALNGLILFSGRAYTIYAKYIDDSGYYIDTNSAYHSYESGMTAPIEGTHYTISHPNGQNGWYKKDGQLEICPIGIFDQIIDRSQGDDDTWTDKLIKSDETSKDGLFVTFSLRSSITGETSSIVTVPYKLDSTAPDNVTITQNWTKNDENYEWERIPCNDEIGWEENKDEYLYQVTLSAHDNLSGIEYFKWRYKDSKDWQYIDAVPDPNTEGLATAQIGVNYSQWYESNGIEVIAYDYAGNSGQTKSADAQQSIIVEYDTSDIIRYTANKDNGNNKIIWPEDIWVKDNGNDNINKDKIDDITNLIYNKATTAAITIPNDEELKENIQISLNEQAIAKEDIEWVLDEENSAYKAVINLKEGNSLIKINPNADKEYNIISNEIGSKIVKDLYISKIHTVDTTKPVINTEIGEITDDGSRDITIIIKDKNFRASELYFSEINVTDIQGEPVNEFNADVFLDELRNAQWKLTDTDYDEDTDKDEYAATVTLSVNANYSFTLQCKDLAGNEAVPALVEFSIDKDPPENLQINYITKPVNVFLQIITFGYYKPSVTIEIQADDAVTGVDHFNWTYTRQEGVSDINKENESGQIDCTDSEHFSYKNHNKTAIATFTLTADEFAQYRGSISFTATDKAGHISDIHYGDGTAIDENGDSYDTDSEHVIVVDTIAPQRVITYPQPQQIRDKDTLEPYTGNKAEYVNQENINSIIYYDNTYGDTIPVTLKITEANFYAQDVIIKINDNDYTIDNWSQNGDEWTGIINLTDDGQYIITVEYIDRSGNIMQSYESETIIIDRVNPVIDKYEFEPADSDGNIEANEFIEVLEYGYYFKTNFKLKIHTSDALPSSGLDKIEYRLVPYIDGIKQDEITGTLPITDGVAYLNIPARFKGQIFTQSYDNTGNKSDEVTPQAFVIDEMAPLVDVVNNSTTTYTDAAGNPLYIEDTSVTVTITDMASGIKEIGYAQDSEKASFARKNIIINNTGYNIGDDVGDGWIISEMDVNLVTKITKTFYYNSDDNDIMLTIDAADRSGNKKEGIVNKTFTIDKTAPIINVVFREDDDTDLYYDANRIADITVIERNFDASRINAVIENTFGDIPGFTFTDVSNTEHTAVIDFDEGDYTFEMNGTDLGDHIAIVNYSGGNENLFYVDKTKPVISDNFIEFSNETTENSFNYDMTASVSVTEHNFDPNLINLRILRKDAGSNHNNSGLVDVTAQLLSSVNWSSNGDIHTISFTISQDAVYQIEMTPADLAGNTADYRSTVVFEIDKTAPVISARNGQYVSGDDIEFLDVYTYDRKDEAAPTIEFSDANIDHIKYALTVWIPDYSNPESLPTVKPKTVYLNEDPNKTGIISGGKFTLPGFIKDGVYTVELIAVDVAGNESALNTNTYARLVENDVLAFILNSNVENKTGLYSFQYENGTPISMRPDNFSDLEIFVLARKDTNVDIVLRDTNAQEISANAQVTTDDSIYGFTIYYYLLKSDFFKDNFSDDMDADLHLTVKNDDKRIDLGKIHIDNMAPTYALPNDFNSWHWYFGNETRTITISNINELLDQNNCKVYDNGKEIDFDYSSQTNTVSFALAKGWHNVGIVLNDTAGNENNIPEKIYMHVGYFWLWIIISVSVIIIFSISFVLIRNRNKKRKLENE